MSFYEESYTLLRDAVLEHLSEFVTPDDVAEEALCIDAIRRAATALAARTREVEAMRAALHDAVNAALDSAVARGERYSYTRESSLLGSTVRGEITSRRGDLCDMAQEVRVALNRALAAQEGT